MRDNHEMQQTIDMLNVGIKGLPALILAAQNIRANYVDEAEDDALVEDATTDGESIPSNQLMGWVALDDAIHALEQFKPLMDRAVSVDFLGHESDDPENCYMAGVHIEDEPETTSALDSLPATFEFDLEADGPDEVKEMRAIVQGVLDGSAFASANTYDPNTGRVTLHTEENQDLVHLQYCIAIAMDRANYECELNDSRYGLI